MVIFVKIAKKLSFQQSFYTFCLWFKFLRKNLPFLFDISIQGSLIWIFWHNSLHAVQFYTKYRKTSILLISVEKCVFKYRLKKLYILSNKHAQWYIWYTNGRGAHFQKKSSDFCVAPLNFLIAKLSPAPVQLAELAIL